MERRTILGISRAIAASDRSTIPGLRAAQRSTSRPCSSTSPSVRTSRHPPETAQRSRRSSSLVFRTSSTVSVRPPAPLPRRTGAAGPAGINSRAYGRAALVRGPPPVPPSVPENPEAPRARFWVRNAAPPLLWVSGLSGSGRPFFVREYPLGPFLGRPTSGPGSTTRAGSDRTPLSGVSMTGGVKHDGGVRSRKGRRTA